MNLRLEKLAPAIGASITGIDLSDNLDADTVRRIAAALRMHGVLVFPRQAIDDAAHVRFARNFGELGLFGDHGNSGGSVREIFRVANTDPAGHLLPVECERTRLHLLNWSWHTDNTYCSIPTRGAVLRAIEVPEDSGQTMFANLVAAYEQLPAATKKRIAGLYARHSFEFLVTSRGLPAMNSEELARLPPVEHPLVRQHADGRRSIYLSPPYMERIAGWTQSDSLALVRELAEWSTQDQFTYCHRWRSDDLLMWDNGWTMHKVMPYDYARRKRVLHGTTLIGVERILPVHSR